MSLIDKTTTEAKEQESLDQIGERLCSLDNVSRSGFREAYRKLSPEVKEQLRRSPRYGWIHRAVCSAG